MAARERLQLEEDEEEKPEVLAIDEARQGMTGHNVRYVLGWGIFGKVAAFAIILAVYTST
jgi:hypothetical protein